VKRFADPQTFRSSALSQYGRHTGRATERGARHLPQQIAGAVDRAAILVRQPAFDLYQYALLGLADNACGRLADFYPDALCAPTAGLERFAATPL